MKKNKKKLTKKEIKKIKEMFDLWVKLEIHCLILRELYYSLGVLDIIKDNDKKM